MIKHKLHISLCASFLLAQSIVYAHESIILDTASVETQIIEDSAIIGSQNIVTAKEIEHTPSAEMLNPYKAISLEPGVDIRSNDPFGMDIKHLIRGKSNRNIGETFEGLPLKGIGPGDGLSTMVDLENIESISVEKGAIKADSGFGYGSDNGMVDMKIKKPNKEFGITIKQSLGSYNFSKTYLRVDSGEIADSAKIFVSSSITNADKFKGEGESPDRKNFAFGIASTSNQQIEWELYGIYNHNKKHNYRGLSYAESQDLEKYKDLDYNTQLTGNPTDDAYYYDYNKQDFETYTVFGKIKVPLSSASSLTLRPYFLNDKGNSYSGSNGKVIDWLVDHNTYGGILEYALNILESKIKIGYWYQEDEPPGPPTSRKLLDTNLNFIKWERVLKVQSNHTFHAPYLTYEKAVGNTIISAGLKYLWMSSPNLVSYNTAGISDGDYNSALAQAQNIDFTLPSNTYGIFLPNLGAVHYLDDYSSLKASYGRNYNVPNYSFGGSMISYYNKPNIDEKLIQTMWANLKPEESDNFDLSYLYKSRKFDFESTLFYSLIKNVGGNFYDPSLQLTVQQNTAEARSYGVELAAGYHITDNFQTHASLTYTEYGFTSDINAASGTVIHAKGNQLPDIPNIIANISAHYTLQGYTLSPTLRYLGKRYVDVENDYSLDPHYLVDISLSKEFALDEKQRLAFSLSVTNLLGEEYISTISTSETNVAEVGPTYIVGAPRTVFASIEYKY